VQPAFHGPGEPKEDRFAVVKLRFELPHTNFLYTFSRAHPEILIVITATQQLDPGRVLAELDLVEPSPTDHSEELQHLRGVFSATRLGPIGPRTRYQGTAEKPAYLVLADELEVLCRYPRIVQNGEHAIEVASRVSQLRKLVLELRDLSSQVVVGAFGRERMRTLPAALTPRQDALLHQALAAGYFDVPRGISLTGLARKLGRSKSSVSQALALIEKQLIESSVARIG
jgi:HTH DNA binding domain